MDMYIHQLRLWKEYMTAAEMFQILHIAKYQVLLLTALSQGWGWAVALDLEIVILLVG